MRRDQALINELLTKIEAFPGKPSWTNLTLERDDAASQHILDHLKVMEEMGLITSTPLHLHGFRMPHNIELLTAGHDALDASRAGEAIGSFGNEASAGERFNRGTVHHLVNV